MHTWNIDAKPSTFKIVCRFSNGMDFQFQPAKEGIWTEKDNAQYALKLIFISTQFLQMTNDLFLPFRGEGVAKGDDVAYLPFFFSRERLQNPSDRIGPREATQGV